jgi:hypothetical protein
MILHQTCARSYVALAGHLVRGGEQLVEQFFYHGGEDVGPVFLYVAVFGVADRVEVYVTF